MKGNSMAQKLSEQVESTLAVFRKDIGEALFPKIVNDFSSWLGRQSITVTDGEWKATSKLSLTAKDSSKMSLPPNDPRSHLFWFAIRLNEVAKAGEFAIAATVPQSCRAWIDKSKKEGVPA